MGRKMASALIALLLGLGTTISALAVSPPPTLSPRDDGICYFDCMCLTNDRQASDGLTKRCCVDTDVYYDGVSFLFPRILSTSPAPSLTQPELILLRSALSHRLSRKGARFCQMLRRRQSQLVQRCIGVLESSWFCDRRGGVGRNSHLYYYHVVSLRSNILPLFWLLRIPKIVIIIPMYPVVPQCFSYLCPPHFPLCLRYPQIRKRL